MFGAILAAVFALVAEARIVLAGSARLNSLLDERAWFRDRIPLGAQLGRVNFMYRMKEDGTVDVDVRAELVAWPAIAAFEFVQDLKADVAEGVAPEAAITFDDILVGQRSLPNATAFYKTRLVQEQPTRMAQAKVSIPVLDAMKEIGLPLDVCYKYRCVGAYAGLLAGKTETFTYVCNRPLDDLTLVVENPPGFELRVESVAVLDNLNGATMHDEMRLIDQPVHPNRKILWHVAKPKVGYRYVLSLRASKLPPA